MFEKMLTIVIESFNLLEQCKMKISTLIIEAKQKKTCLASWHLAKLSTKHHQQTENSQKIAENILRKLKTL